MTRHHALGILALFFFAVACDKQGDGEKPCLGGEPACGTAGGGTDISTEPQSSSANGLTCTARTFTASGATSTVNSGEVFGVEFRVSGGRSPYTVPKSQHPYASSFADRIVLFGYNTNSTAKDMVVTRSATITDSDGRTASCPFSITVRSSTNPSRFSCTLAAQPSTASVGQRVDFTATAVNAPSSVRFVSLRPNGNWQIPDSYIRMTSATAASASVAYSYPGSFLASVVAISGGSSAVCTTAVTVNQLALEVAASPSKVVPINAELTIHAKLTGHSADATPTFTYETSEPNIGFVNNGTSARVLNNDGQYHKFTVKVTATVPGGASVSKSIDLTFTNTNQLNCQLTASPSTLFANENVTVTAELASGTNFGEALRIEKFKIDGVDQSLPAGTGASWVGKVATSGVHTLSARIVSVNTSTPCNGGSDIVLSGLKFYDRLKDCNFSVSPSRAPVNTVVTGTVSRGSHAYNGVGPFRIKFLDADNGHLPSGTLDLSGGANPTPTQQTFRITQAGIFTLIGRLEDKFDGREVVCSTTFYSY